MAETSLAERSVLGGSQTLVAGGGGVMAITVWPVPGDGAALATAGVDGTIRRWHAVTGDPIGRPCTGHLGNVWTVTTWAMPDGRPALASAGVDQTIRLWDAALGAPVAATMSDGSEAIRALAAFILPDGSPALASRE